MGVGFAISQQYNFLIELNLDWTEKSVSKTVSNSGMAWKVFTRYYVTDDMLHRVWEAWYPYIVMLSG